MSQITVAEMEAKRQEMIASFKDIAAAMTRCVSIIEDYTRLSPSNVPPANLADALTHILPSISNGHSEIDPELMSTLHDQLPGLEAATPAAETPGPKKRRSKKEKKIRDPNAPKRPASAYILFQNDVREKLRADNPALAYQEILAAVAQQWKTLDPAQKSGYEQTYKEAKEIFQVQDAAYKEAVKANGGIPPTPAPAAAALSSDSSDDSNSESDSDTPANTKSKSSAKPKIPQAATTLLSTITPQVLGAAVAAVESGPKKVTKRKQKADEAAVNATLQAEPEKKKGRKKKEQAAAAA